MKDRALIEEMIVGTHARIRDIELAVWRKAGVQLALEMPELGPIDETADEMPWEIIEELWCPPLTDVAVRLLWAVAKRASDGEFVADTPGVAAICAAMDDEGLRNATGIAQEHVRTVLEKMGEALVEVVRAHSGVDIYIDRKPYRLRAE